MPIMYFSSGKISLLSQHKKGKRDLSKAVLRIHLILMRIRILDPHWKKMDPDLDPDPGHFFKIY